MWIKIFTHENVGQKYRASLKKGCQKCSLERFTTSISLHVSMQMNAMPMLFNEIDNFIEVYNNHVNLFIEQIPTKKHCIRSITYN